MPVDDIPRPLGAYERYSLARSRVGAPPVLAFLCTLPSSAESVGIDRIRAACNELVEQYPLLACTIIDIRTRVPKIGTKPNLEAEVSERDLQGGDDTSILGDLLEQGRCLDLEEGPLWKVFWSKATSGRPKLAIVVNHVVTDGLGARELLADLIRLVASPGGCANAVSALPPTLESTVPVKPGLRHIVQTVAAELIVPRLPTWIRPSPAVVCWPEKLTAAPHEKVTGLKITRVPAERLALLRAQAKAHGFTIQTMLHIALLAAIKAGIQSPGAVEKPLPLSATTPISLRSTDAGHPRATGNYVGVIESLDLVERQSRVLSLGQKYATQLASPSEKLKAKHNVGMLGWVPDPVIAADAEWTGFEEYILQKRNRPVPFSSSFEVSNLGVLHVPKTWSEENLDVVWAQAGSTIGAAIALNVLSVSGGALSLSLTWRKDSLEDAEIEKIWQAMLRALQRLAIPIDHKLTIAELTS